MNETEVGLHFKRCAFYLCTISLTFVEMFQISQLMIVFLETTTRFSLIIGMQSQLKILFAIRLQLITLWMRASASVSRRIKKAESTNDPFYGSKSAS